MSQPKYDVLWPLARRAVKDMAMNRRFGRPGTDTDNDNKNTAKRIGFIWDYMFRGNDMFPLLQAGLAEKYPGSTFVPYEHFGNVHGHDEREVLAALPQRLKEARLDAVIVGVGA